MAQFRIGDHVIVDTHGAYGRESYKATVIGFGPATDYLKGRVVVAEEGNMHDLACPPIEDVTLPLEVGDKVIAFDRYRGVIVGFHDTGGVIVAVDGNTRACRVFEADRCTLAP